MYEPIEDDTWVCPVPLPPDLAERLQAAAIQNGRTLSEEFTYQILVKLGMIPPSHTH